MGKRIRGSIIFITSFIISFFTTGYVINTKLKVIDWIEGATLWDKFDEYYIRTFFHDAVPASIIALIATGIFLKRSDRRNK